MLQGKGPVTTLLESTSSEQTDFPLNCMCLCMRRDCPEASPAGIKPRSVFRYLTIFVQEQETCSFSCVLYHNPPAPGELRPTLAMNWWNILFCQPGKQPLQIVAKAGVFREVSCLTLHCFWRQVLHPVTFQQQRDQTTRAQPLSGAAAY